LYAFQNPTVFVDPDGRQNKKIFESTDEEGRQTFSDRGPLGLVGQNDSAENPRLQRNQDCIDDPGCNLFELDRADGRRARENRQQQLALAEESDSGPEQSEEDAIRDSVRSTFRDPLKNGAKQAADGLSSTGKAGEAFLPASTGELIVGIGVGVTKVVRVFTKDGRTEPASQEDLAGISRRRGDPGNGSFDGDGDFDGFDKPFRGAKPEVKFVDESASMSDRARRFEDSAIGARSNPVTRSGQAPQLTRKLTDGTERPVRFDGLEGDVLIDRKLSVVTTKKAQNQAVRQSEALSQNGYRGRWEVPNESQKRRAESMFKKLDINNISVRVVSEP